MTREEACKKAQIIDFQGGYTIALVTEIYDDHETTIEILMKANEEEISRHFNECEKYEAQLKAKDEEIEELKKCNKLLYSLMVSGERRGVEKAINKARSIVAMLFWIFVKNRRLYKTNKYFTQEAVTESFFCFQQAQKQLKEQQ